MAIEIASNYNSVYESTYSAQKQQNTSKTGSKEADRDYINKLQKQVPSMIVRVGDSIPTSKDRRVGTLTLNSSILDQMKNNPEKEKYYTQRMKDIERAEKLGESITSSRGFTTEYSHWYIDKDGKIWHTARTVRKDKLNEKLRKEAQENVKKQIEKTRENARNKKEQLTEQLEEKAKKMISEKIENAQDGEMSFDDKEIQTLIEAAKQDDQKKTGNHLDLHV